MGLSSRLERAARARLVALAGHLASVAAAVYEGSGGWTPEARTELRHLAALDGLRLSLLLPGHEVVPVRPGPAREVARASVTSHGRLLATVSVSYTNGALIPNQDQGLESSLDRLHLVAAAVAAFAALVVGLGLAEALSRPLRRTQAAAERLEQGDLEARAEATGAPEVQAVGRALNRLAETLGHEEELRKQKMADLAHELRTPVNGLLFRIEAAEDGLLPLPENLAAMHDEATRLTRLLDDLSRLGDAERPGLLLDKAPVNLAEVAEAVGRAFAARFSQAGIAFSSTGAPAWALGDPGRIEQVVANLLSNALAYTEPGGRVSLRVGSAGPEAFLEVADTGIGIDPEDLGHIYTRFWRGDRSRSRSTGGSGIGLAIVKELVRAHGGHIDVDSVPGRGSRFKVVLPALKRGATAGS